MTALWGFAKVLIWWCGLVSTTTAVVIVLMVIWVTIADRMRNRREVDRLERAYRADIRRVA